MANTPVGETLTITVKVNNTDALKGLKDVTAAVENLAESTKKSGIERLSSIAASVRGLALAAKSASDTSGKFTELSKSIQSMLGTFRNFNPGKYASGIAGMTQALSSTGSALRNFVDSSRGTATSANALKNLTGAMSAYSSSVGNLKIDEMASSMEKLGASTTQMAASGHGLKAFSAAVKDLPSAIDAFSSPKNTQNIDDSAQAFTRLSDATQNLAESGNGMKAYGTGIRSVVTALNELPGALAAFDKKGMGGFFSSGMDKYSKNVGTVIQNMSKGMQGVDTKVFDAVGRFASGLKTLVTLSGKEDLSANLERIAASIADFTTKLMNAIPEDVLNRFERLGNAMANLRVNTDLGSKAGGMKGFMSGAEVAKKLASSLATDFKRAARAGMEIAKLPFKMLLAPMQGVAAKAAGLANSFSRLFSTIGRVAFMRAIRAGIKMVVAGIREGIDHLYLWASVVGNSFKPTMDSIATSFLYLKNSIGAAVSPILDALAPAIEVAVNKLVDLINVFNQVIATLTGASTWRKAIRSAADYSDNISGLGHEATDANDAVKELRATLLKFDEINRLDDKEKTISKAKNGKPATGMYAQDGALSFVEQPISQKALDIAQMLRDAWAKADFYDIGEMIGTKLGNMMMDVPWKEKIQPAVVKIASSFATLLNGMFDYRGKGGKAMWDGIAYTAYNALNTAMLGYVTFFGKVQWGGIGEGFGAAMRKVLQDGINYKLVADALSAFPNAVIKAINGFNSEFKVKDFADIGQKIGNSIAQALMNIDWKMLFTDIFGVASRVVVGLNGALKGFNANWGDIKNAILDGIKNVPKTDWYNLGTSIGELIFNTATFIGNVVDVLVSAIESGSWGELIDGIIAGINKHVDWKTAPKKIGDWISDHINIVTIALGFTFGKFAVEMGVKALTQKLLVAPLIGGGSLATWMQGIELAAGITLAINAIGSIWAHDFKKGSLASNLATLFKNTFKGAIAGAAIGLAFGGPAGALVGTLSGILLTLVVAGIKWDPFSEKTKKEITQGVQDNIDRELADAQLNFDPMNYNNEWAMWGQNDGTVTSSQNRTVGAGKGTNQWSETVTYQATLDTSNSKDWLKILQNAWNNIVKNNKVARFFTEGVVNKALDWWGSVKEFWSNAIKGKFASKFTIEGIVNQAVTWWSNVQDYWSNAIRGKAAERFNILGIVNSAMTWWSNVQGYWSSAISGRTASPFSIAGVVNAATSWWNQTEGFWNSATRYSSLVANVTTTISNSTLVNTFNAAQTWLNNHPVTAIVQTQSTAPKISGKASTVGRNNADGGIYKNGVWYPVTNYASGGLVSGEMFIAREAGPELVGTIGGNTAVMNNDQIVASVSAGVAQAVASVMGGSNTNDIVIKIDSETIYRAVKKGERMANGRYGTVVTVG